MGKRGPKATTEHLYRRGKIWWCWYYDQNGERVRRSTATTDKAVARSRFSSWERAALDPHAEKLLTLNDCLRALLDERSACTGKQNIAFLDGKVKALVTVLGHELFVNTIRDSTIAWTYIDERRRMFVRKRPVGDRTIRRELVVLRAALALAKSRGRWAGDLDAVIPDDFTVPRAPKGDVLSRRDALRIFPHLAPDVAAATAFVLATGAELSALRRALKTDLPREIASCAEVLIRGTKNERRHAIVPVVTDEQRVLLEHVRKHARAPGDRLFGNVHRLIKGLRDACLTAKITVVSPHDLRRSAGQWMVDLGVPIELVSKFMRHADTRVTETIYASIKREDVGDRILQAIDPRYALATHRHPKKSPVETLTSIPHPKVSVPLYDVDGVARSLAEWSREAGIPKATLHHRVVTRGMTMVEAIGIGRATYKKRGGGGGSGSTAGGPGAGACVTGVTVSAVGGGSDAQKEHPSPEGSSQIPADFPENSVRPDRFERTTFGFEGARFPSVSAGFWGS
jgi:integrase